MAKKTDLAIYEAKLLGKQRVALRKRQARIRIKARKERLERIKVSARKPIARGADTGRPTRRRKAIVSRKPVRRISTGFKVTRVRSGGAKLPPTIIGGSRRTRRRRLKKR